MHGDPQPTPESDVKNFRTRVCVAGTRQYSDYDLFCEVMKEYIANLGDDSIVFLSGGASTGADAMIIRWCKENKYPWAEYHAKWDDIEVPGAVVRYNKRGKPYNVLAGFMRNVDMAKALTHLLTFYDGVSSGTSHMIKEATSRKAKVLTVLIDIKEGEKHAWKP